MKLLEMQMTTNQLTSVDLTAGFVKLKDPRTRPGGTENIFDQRGMGIIKFRIPHEMPDIKPGDELNLYEERRNGGNPFFTIGL